MHALFFLYKVCVEEFNAYFGKRVFRIYIITLFLLNVWILLWKAREILKGICIYVNIFFNLQLRQYFRIYDDLLCDPCAGCTVLLSMHVKTLTLPVET